MVTLFLTCARTGIARPARTCPPGASLAAVSCVARDSPCTDLSALAAGHRARPPVPRTPRAILSSREAC